MKKKKAKENFRCPICLLPMKFKKDKEGKLIYLECTNKTCILPGEKTTFVYERLEK